MRLAHHTPGGSRRPPFLSVRSSGRRGGAGGCCGGAAAVVGDPRRPSGRLVRTARPTDRPRVLCGCTCGWETTSLCGTCQRAAGGAAGLFGGRTGRLWLSPTSAIGQQGSAATGACRTGGYLYELLQPPRGACKAFGRGRGPTAAYQWAPAPTAGAAGQGVRGGGGPPHCNATGGGTVLAPGPDGGRTTGRAGTPGPPPAAPDAGASTSTTTAASA